jgi:glucuronoarabinoxylan endo-1,4-beta-xylanase
MPRSSPFRSSPLVLLIALVPACAQVPVVTIDTSVRRQTIEGFGATATGVWNTSIASLFAQPAFAAQIRDDLGATIIRVEIPPEIEAAEDLQPTILNMGLFSFSPMLATGTLAQNLNHGNPGAVKIIGTIWSPPGWMKTNGSPANGGSLRTDRYSHFAKYCAGASLGFEQTYGVPLYAISPQNEPVFDEPYNSCVYTPEQYRDTVAAVAGAFSTWGAHSKVYGSEDVGTVPSRWLSFATTVAQNPAALQRMDSWAIHSYPWNNGVDATSPDGWTALVQQVQPLGKPVWVSEVSGEDPSWMGTSSNPKGAFTLARQIQDALVYGEVTAYVYWAISDPAPSSFALMGLGAPTKKYYAARQFYKYIRPGAVRVGATSGDPNVSASAFVHDQQRTMTVVLINQGTAPSSVQLAFSGTEPTNPMTTVRTSATEDGVQLSPTAVSGGRAYVTIPAQSVMTLTAPTASMPPCYANCDGSGTSPVLNVADFTCFLQKFSTGDPYANCDGSTLPPVLNVADMTCFVQRYVAGCP